MNSYTDTNEIFGGNYHNLYLFYLIKPSYADDEWQSNVIVVVPDEHIMFLSSGPVLLIFGRCEYEQCDLQTILSDFLFYRSPQLDLVINKSNQFVYSFNVYHYSLRISLNSMRPIDAYIRR